MNFSKSVYVLKFRKEFLFYRSVYQFHHNTDRCGCLFPVETGLEPVRTLAQRFLCLIKFAVTFLVFFTFCQGWFVALVGLEPTRIFQHPLLRRAWLPLHHRAVVW